MKVDTTKTQSSLVFLSEIVPYIDSSGWWDKYYLVFIFDVTNVQPVSGIFLRERRVRISKRQYLQLKKLITE